MAGWAGAGARWAAKTALYKKNVNKRGLINKTRDLSALLIVTYIYLFQLHSFLNVFHASWSVIFKLWKVGRSLTPIKYCSSSFRHVPVVPHSSWTICLHLRPLHGVTYFIIHYNNIIYISLGAISSVMARVTKLGIMKQMPRHGAVFGQLTGCHDQSTQHPAPKIYLHITKNIWGSNNIWKPASVLR